jgi:AcrR family transcriptional regulator
VLPVSPRSDRSSSRVSSSRGSRPELSAEYIADTGVRIADEEGVGAVSMRRLAKERGVTPMAHYWHVDDKDRLLDLMAERVVAVVEFPSSPQAPWEERLRQVLSALTGLLRQHPWMGRIVIERVVPLPQYLAALELLLEVLRDAGVPDRRAGILVEHLVQDVVTMVEFEPAAVPAEELGAECVDRHEALAALPAERYPRVRATAAMLAGSTDPEEYLEVGTTALVGAVREAAR